MKCPAGQLAITVAAPPPSWLTRTCYFDGNKMHVSEVLGHPVHLRHMKPKFAALYLYRAVKSESEIQPNLNVHSESTGMLLFLFAGWRLR